MTGISQGHKVMDAYIFFSLHMIFIRYLSKIKFFIIFIIYFFFYIFFGEYIGEYEE